MQVGGHLPCAGGGDLQPRYFAIDLDAAAPQAVPLGGDRDEPMDQLDPPVRFPYQVSSSEVEVFYLEASVTSCLCRWKLALDWTSGGRTGTTVVDLDGAPFAAVGGAEPAGEPIVRNLGA